MEPRAGRSIRILLLSTLLMAAMAGAALWSQSGGAERVPIFSERLTRTAGAPNDVARSITVPPWIVAPFVLEIRNGEPDGSRRVSSASISIDGREILRPSDLNQRVPGLTRTVSLEGVNTLHARLAGAPGGFLVVAMTGARGDHTAPSLSIAAPLGLVNTRPTPIVVQYADVPGPGDAAAAGVVPDTLRVTIDGNDATPLFAAGDTQATVAVALADGVHRVDVLIADAAGNTATTSASVTVDTTPPAVTSTVPAPGATDVDTDVSVMAMFGEALSPASVTSAAFTLHDAGGQAVPATVSYDPATRIAALDPVEPLAGSTAYTARVNGSGSYPRITDHAGNAATAFSWSFTTVDAIPLAVVSTSPSDDGRFTRLDAELRITFSTALDPASVTPSAIQLWDTRNVPVEGSVTYDADALTVIFTPAHPLLPTRRYTATVAGGQTGARVTSVSGRSLPQSHSWSFITTVRPRRIAAGSTHSVALDDAGRVWTWGSDSLGERGTDLDGRVPGAVSAAHDVVSIAAGHSLTLALKADGTVLAWGSNFSGQTGAGSVPPFTVTTPIAVPGLTGVVAVEAGASHSAVLKADGTVWTWGGGPYIGDGANVQRLTPTRVPSLSDVIAIAAGSSYTLALTAAGEVWGWGDNGFGTLGDGTTTSRLAPVRVTGLTGVVDISGGWSHSLAIASDLSLVAWGTNGSGQLGDGTLTRRLTPVIVPGVSDVTAADVGFDRSVIVRLDGSVRAWGTAMGASGSDAPTPLAVSGLDSIWQVSAGTHHLLAVTRSGVVSSWSTQNQDGQLGNGTTTALPIPGSISQPGYAWKVGTPSFNRAPGLYLSPFTVTITCATPGATIRYTLDGRDPTESDPVIASGAAVSIVTSSVLKARAWKTGQAPSSIAAAAYTFKVATPSLSPSGGTFTTTPNVSVTTSTAGAAIRYTTDGSEPDETSRLYLGAFTVLSTTVVKAAAFRAGWARSDTRTGTFTLNFGTLAAPVLTPPGGTYDTSVTVSAAGPAGATVRYTTDGSTPTSSSPIYGGPMTFATTTTLKAKAFRTNYTTSAEASASYTIRVPTPTLSLESGTYTPGTTVVIASDDPEATIHITLDGTDPLPGDREVTTGTVLLAGDFTLKARAFRNGTTPSAVAAATYASTDALSAGALASGRAHAVLATPGGLVYTWGANESGQLGDGGTLTRTRPALIALTGVTAVAAGRAHTLALRHDGRVFAWGDNGFGAVGDGTGTNRSTPAAVGTLTNVVGVAAGHHHSLALTIAGDVYAWGLSDQGQLGLGSTDTQVLPVRVLGLPNIVAIAAGGAHSLAVTSAGQVFAWGNSRLAPVLVEGLSGVVQVAAGAAHSLVRLSSGAVYAWGSNGDGQLGLGHTVDQTAPALIPGLTATSIGAGARHSTATGSVLAWGANDAGQLGDGTIAARPTPTTVSGIDRAVLMAAGESHTVAVAPDGHLWTWGANDSGQLGDGTTAGRPAPADVMTMPGAWDATPPPQVSPASGVYGARQTALVWSALPDATIRYTTNGAIPTENDPIVASGGSIEIADTMTLRLRAWSPAKPPSAVVATAYVLTPGTPVITPAGGTYTAAQSVTLATATTDAIVRYTLDGSEPTDTSTVYGGPIAIDGFAVIKARAFRGGWTPSATASSTFTFQLAAPDFSPPGGRYLTGQIVALTAQPDTEIRLTDDGTDPTSASSLYAGPFALPTEGATLKARAFRPGWLASPVAAAAFTISTDITPPTIAASLSAAPGMGGWFTAPVTVTFACADAESGITFCTPPQQIDSDGADNEVVGRAINGTGMGAATTVRLSVDRTAPTLTVYSPSTTELPAGTSAITVTGGVVDFGAGVEAVICGNTAATVVGQSFSCGVSVTPGVNTIAITAVDRAGHTGTRQLTVDVGAAGPAATALEISPARLTMFGNESRTLNVTDERGRPVTGGTWAVSQPLIAEVTVVDGAITIRGLASGEATLTVTHGGLTAQAVVTVITVADGDPLPQGTTLWSLADMSTPKRGMVLRATPPEGATTSPLPLAELYFIDEGTELLIGQPTRFFNRPTRIIATAADGRKLWERSFTDRIVKQFAADVDGGLVLAYDGQTMLGNIWSPPMIQRIDGRTGAVRDEVRFENHISEMAVHPDGTLYLTEDAIFGISKLVEIPRTGTMIKHPLPEGHFTRVDSGPFFMGADANTPASATHPIVLDDGTVALVARTRFVKTWVISYLGFNGPSWRTDFSQPSIIEATMHLVTKRSGQPGVSVEPLNTSTHFPSDPGAFSAFDPWFYRLLPDGQGGLLLSHREAGWLTRIAPDLVLSGASVTGFPAAGTRSEVVLGEDGVYVLSTGQISASGGPFYWASVQSRNPVTLDLLSQSALGSSTTAVRHLAVQFALPGGGIYISGPTEAYAVNAATSAAGFGAGGNATEIHGRLWAGWSTGPAVITGGEAGIATTTWPYASGDGRANAAFPTAPTIEVHCRPVEGNAGFVGDHCYAVVWRGGTDIRWVESGPNLLEPPPYGLNVAAEKLTKPEGIDRSWWIVRGNRIAATESQLQCLTLPEAVTTWNLGKFVYDPLSRNSNTFLSWILRECHATRAQPPVFARAIGWVK